MSIYAKKVAALNEFSAMIIGSEQKLDAAVKRGEGLEASKLVVVTDLILRIAELAGRLGCRSRALEALGEELYDLRTKGLVGPVLSAGRPRKGTPDSAAVAVFKGRVIACMERLQDFQHELTLVELNAWARASMKSAKAEGRVFNTSNVTASAVRGWWERYRGRSDEHIAQAYRATLEHLRTDAEAPRTQVDLDAFLQNMARELPSHKT